MKKVIIEVEIDCCYKCYYLNRNKRFKLKCEANNRLIKEDVSIYKGISPTCPFEDV